MPRLTFVARNKDGNRITGTEDVADSDSLIMKLQNQGLIVIEVKPFQEGTSQVKEKSKGGRKNATTHHKVKIMDLVLLARQLATMLDAGVTLLRALEVITQQVESVLLYRAMEQVIHDLEKGSSFSSALSKHPKVFSQFWTSLVEVGEASGSLPVILEKLADYQETMAAFQAKIISAMFYPGVLLVVAVGAIAFFAGVIVPKFTEIFKSLNIPLPIMTKVLLQIFDILRTKFFFLLGLLVVIIFLVKRYINTELGKKQAEAIILKLPIFGNFYRLLVIERFSSQMAILIGSGVPILYALEISERMVISKTMALVIEKIKNQVREGKLIAEPMEKSGFFTPMAVQMVLIGEETGELDKMLRKVSEFYQAYVETFVERLSTLIEPLMLILMGGVVGLIVIAMFLPIFSIASGGGGMAGVK